MFEVLWCQLHIVDMKLGSEPWIIVPRLSGIIFFITKHNIEHAYIQKIDVMSPGRPSASHWSTAVFKRGHQMSKSRFWLVWTKPLPGRPEPCLTKQWHQHWLKKQRVVEISFSLYNFTLIYSLAVVYVLSNAVTYLHIKPNRTFCCSIFYDRASFYDNDKQ